MTNEYTAFLNYLMSKAVIANGGDYVCKNCILSPSRRATGMLCYGWTVKHYGRDISNEPKVRVCQAVADLYNTFLEKTSSEGIPLTTEEDDNIIRRIDIE